MRHAMVLAGAVLAASAALPAAGQRPEQGTQTLPRTMEATVVSYNPVSRILQVRREDGGLEYVSLRRAEMLPRDGGRAAMVRADALRPDSRVEIQGRSTLQGIIVAQQVRLLEAPSREDRFAGGVRTTGPTSDAAMGRAPETDAPTPGAGRPAERVAGRRQEAWLAYRGPVVSVDPDAGVFKLRNGERVMTVRSGGATRFTGIDAQRPDVSFLRPGDQVTVAGSVRDGALLAERITLDPPGAPAAADAAAREDTGITVDLPPTTGTRFEGVIVSMDAARSRVRVRGPQGERVFFLRDARFFRGDGEVIRGVLRPGMRLRVTAREVEGGWGATEVRIL